jgi:hypothetical protein
MTPFRTKGRLAAHAFGLVIGAWLISPGTAHAADQYVSRPLTLPRLNFAFDAGLGVRHVDFGNNTSAMGPGINLEAALGITSNIELGFRTGLRLNDDAGLVQADTYGRLYDTETYGVGGDRLANPEFRLTGRVLNAEVAEIGLEGRVYLPFEQGTHFVGAFGAPFLFHFGRIVRLDLGAYIVTIFDEEDRNGGRALVIRPLISVPARLWFQVSDRVWLGPIAGIRHDPGRNNANVLLGFGLGYQITSFLDFKTQFVFPEINNARGTNDFAFAGGIQVRIE